MITITAKNNDEGMGELMEFGSAVLAMLLVQIGSKIMMLWLTKLCKTLKPCTMDLFF